MGKHLTDLNITFYNDLIFIGADEVPDCRTQIDQDFGPTIAINYLHKGAIHFAVDGQECVRLEGPMIYWTWQNCRYVYGNVANEIWHQLWVQAGGTRALAMRDGNLAPAINQPWAVPSQPESFLARMRRLISLTNNGRTNDQPERAQLLEGLFFEALRDKYRIAETLATDKSGIGEQINALAYGIASDPLAQHDFYKQAKEMGVSYDHFRRCFKQQVGSAPTTYLHDCRIRWAAAKLATGQFSVKEIAYKLGFANPESFTRAYRSRTGFLPKDTLNQSRQLKPAQRKKYG